MIRRRWIGLARKQMKRMHQALLAPLIGAAAATKKDLESAWYILPWKEEIYARTIGMGLNTIITSTVLNYHLIAPQFDVQICF